MFFFSFSKIDFSSLISNQPNKTGIIILAANYRLFPAAMQISAKRSSSRNEHVSSRLEHSSVSDVNKSLTSEKLSVRAKISARAVAVLDYRSYSRSCSVNCIKTLCLDEKISQKPTGKKSRFEEKILIAFLTYF